MKRFFLIHIPKTAGRSVTDRLSKYARNCYPLDKVTVEAGESLCFGHYSPRGIVNTLSPEHNDGTLIVAFIRDPRDRLVSLWYHCRRMGVEHGGFKEFAQKAIYNPLPPVGLYDRKGLSMCNPQARWLDGVKVDFLGRFECLAEDWRRLCHVIEIPFEPLKHVGEYPRERPWQSYYYDDLPFLRDVNKCYSEDLILGGYPYDLRDHYCGLEPGADPYLALLGGEELPDCGCVYHP